MLTQATACAAWAKKLAVLPLMCFFVACFSNSQNSLAQGFVRTGNTVKYKGNTIEMSAAIKDSVIVTNPNTNKDTFVVRTTPAMPLKLNGRKVRLSTDCDTKPMLKDKSQTFFKYIIEPVNPDLELLPSGFYKLDLYNVLIGADGTLDYYDFNGITAIKDSVGNPLKIENGAKKKIDEHFKKLIDKFPTVTPATVEGVKVPCLWWEACREVFMVVNHKVVNHWD